MGHIPEVVTLLPSLRKQDTPPWIKSSFVDAERLALWDSPSLPQLCLLGDTLSAHSLQYSVGNSTDLMNKCLLSSTCAG